LDVNAVFKEHGRFKAAMNDLEIKVKQAEQQVKQERDTIKNLSERLKDYRAGSPEYKQLEEELAKRQSDLSVQVALQRKEFLQQEAKIYHTVYQEIEQEVQYVAASNGIAVVLRYSGEPVDAEKPDDILRDINKSVVWYSDGLDITPIIKARLCQRPMAPGMNQTPPPQARPGVPYQPQQR
jgi:Skp family chaperone for outer membrane proteins